MQLSIELVTASVSVDSPGQGERGSKRQTDGRGGVAISAAVAMVLVCSAKLVRRSKAVASGAVTLEHVFQRMSEEGNVPDTPTGATDGMREDQPERKWMWGAVLGESPYAGMSQRTEHYAGARGGGSNFPHSRGFRHCACQSATRRRTQTFFFSWVPFSRLFRPGALAARLPNRVRAKRDTSVRGLSTAGDERVRSPL